MKKWFKRAISYIFVFFISFILGALFTTYFPKIIFFDKGICYLIFLIILLIIFIYGSFKCLGLSKKNIKQFYTKNEMRVRRLISISIILLIIIPILFLMGSILLPINENISYSDYFNYFGVILTAGIAFASIQYQIVINKRERNANKKEEEKKYIKHEVISRMNSVTQNYRPVFNCLKGAEKEWSDNMMFESYSDLKFEKINNFILAISNYNYICQQENQLIEACRFNDISKKIENLNSKVTTNMAYINTYESVFIDKKGKIDSINRHKISRMNACLIELSELTEDLYDKTQEKMAYLKVNNIKINPKFEIA